MVAYVGAHGNAWNNVATGEDGVSKIFDTGSLPNIAVFGRISDDSNIDLYVSADGTNFYKCMALSEKLPGNSGGSTAVDFHVYFTSGARFIRLKSSVDVTATITISAKR